MRGNTATISVATFKADWLRHIPMRDLCQRYSVSRDQVIRLKHVWRLPPRHDRRLRAKPARAADPTPREIAQACREIQATWSEDTRDDRCAYKRKPVTLQRVDMTDEARTAFDAMPSDDDQ